MRKEPKIFTGDWWYFYFTNDFQFTFENREKFDGRPRLRIAPGFCSLTIKFNLPDKWLSDNGEKKYGLAIHNGSIWLYTGGNGRYSMGKWLSWEFPFINYVWIRTSTLLKDDTWYTEDRSRNIADYMPLPEEDKKIWTYDFTDNYDGAIIPTRIHVDEREWRPKWLTWTSLFKKVRRTIDIEFSAEVGRRKGSYKGGITGTGYDLLPGEDPLDCLKRMEIEREF